MRNKGIIKNCIVVLLFYIVSITCLSCSKSNVPNNKVEVKLIIDGNTYNYDWDYGKYFSLDLKKEFPNILYYSYYLDKEYKDYCEYEPVTNDLTLYVKTFKEPSEELIAKAKEDFVKKYNHELRGECFMQINNDIFIISYSDILDFDSKYAVRNGIISNVRLNDISFIFPCEKSSLALWSDGKFYFNKEIEDRFQKDECVFIKKEIEEKLNIFDDCQFKFNGVKVTLKDDIDIDSNLLFETDLIINGSRLNDFDGQLDVRNKLIIDGYGAKLSKTWIVFELMIDGLENKGPIVLINELRKLDYIEKIEYVGEDWIGL